MAEAREPREPQHLRAVDDIEALIALAYRALASGAEAEASRLMGRVFREAALDDVKAIIRILAKECLGTLGSDKGGQRRARKAFTAAAGAAGAERNEEALRHAQQALAASGHPGANLIVLGLKAVLAADWIRAANEGTEHYAAGRYEQALSCYERAVAANGRNASLWYNKGNALRMMRRPLEEILSCYREAVRLDPRHAGAWTNGALVLELLSRWEEADSFWTESIKLDPVRAEAWVRKALCLYQLGKDADAAPACERAVELKPELGHAWAIKSAVESRLGNADKAREASARASELQKKPTGPS